MGLKILNSLFRKDMLEFGSLVFLGLRAIIKSCHVTDQYLIINIDKLDLIEFFYWARNIHLFSFDFLVDIIVVDLLEFNIEIKNNKRYEFNYLMMSKRFNKRLVVKFTVEDDADLNTITGLYKNGDWLEREVWDFFGVNFLGNKDIRRILTDYGFKGSPLKKDFPLKGLVELKFDEEEKKIIYEKIEAKQPFNILEFLNPWRF